MPLKWDITIMESTAAISDPILRIEMLQPDLDLCRVLALQAVRYNKWSPDDGIIKTMFYCCCQMIDGIMPAARIKCIRIRDKRFCPGCPDLFYNRRTKTGFMYPSFPYSPK